jgi:hypothetical protein
MDGSCSDDSEIEKERAGGGAGPTGAGPAEGLSRRTGGGSGPKTSIRNAGGAFTNRRTVGTLGVRADSACVFYICIWAVLAIRSGIDHF